MTTLKSILIFVKDHRLATAIIIFVLLIISGACARYAKFSENIFDLMPVSDSVVENHIDAARAFKQSNSLYFNISGFERLKARDALSSALKNSGIFDCVSGVANTENIESAVESLIGISPYLFDESSRELVIDNISQSKIAARMKYFKEKICGFGSQVYKRIFLSDPLNLLASTQNKLFCALGNADFASIKNGGLSDKSGDNLLIIASAKYDSSDSAKSAEIVAKTEAILTQIRLAYPQSQIAWSGGYRVASENAKLARSDSAICVLATLFLMLVFCLFAFRNRIFAPIALIPSLIGTALAFAIICLCFPTISTIAIAFASIAVGVSIDYAVHILYFLDKSQKVEFEDALGAVRKYKRPIATVAGTTIAAFIIMYFSGGSQFAQLGAFGALGVLFSALISLFLLPPFLVGIKTRRSGKRLLDTAAQQIVSRLLKYRKIALTLVAVVSILALPQALKLTFDGRISAFNGMTKQAQIDDLQIKEIWKGALSKKIVMVRAKDFDGALAKEELLCKFLESTKIAKSVNALSYLFPSSATAAKNALRWNDFIQKNGDVFKSNFAKAAEEIGVNAKAFDNSLMATLEPISVSGEDILKAENAAKSSLIELIGSRLAVKDGQVCLATFVEIKDGLSARDFADSISSAFEDCAYIDMNFMGERISLLASTWLVNFALIALAVVAVYLYLLLRRFSWVAAVLISVLIGLLWSFGAMRALGISMNLINVIFVIFAVCVAQDYAVFMLLAHADNNAKARTLAAVFISAGTTAGAFAVLAFASHPVLRSLGQAATISVLSILSASILIIPAISKTIFKNDKRR